MLAALALLSGLLFQNLGEARLSGTVRDATGLPLPGATIELNGRVIAVSDERGAFDVVRVPGAGSRLRITMAGFEPYERAITAGDDRLLDVVLEIRPLEDRVTVRAVRPRPLVNPVFTRQPIDTYRTPGAQGDLLRALQTLPGVAAPDDAAGLFVRGGDVSEVLFTVDDAVMAHPYRYETPTGGFRGAVDPLLITGLRFSTGGFSARHGNALSAVVDLQGLDRPETHETSATVGLAGASASVALPLHERFGVRAAANRTFTGLLFAVNGSPRDFDPPPEGWDGSAGVGWNLGRAGALKAFALVQRDSIGVETERDAFAGWLRSSSRHDFGLVRWDGSVGTWAASAVLGTDSYAGRTAVGVLDLDNVDRTRSWRIELTRPGGHLDWRAGANGSATETSATGRVPLAGGDLGGLSGATPFHVEAGDWFAGPYLEATTSARAVSLTAGARVDRFGLAHVATIDPRLQLRVGLGPRQALHYATGIYHQAPAPPYYDRIRGAAQLAPMRAIHHVVGYETGREAEGFYVRAEGYLKRYRDLPLESGDLGYTNAGYGSAEGLDLFLQWRSSRLDVRGTTSWLHARRRWTPAGERGRYVLPEGAWSPAFEIPWSAQLVATAPLGRGLGASASWRSAAGRPHTPIVGARSADGGLVPVFGALNSDRLPRYERLDLSLNWLTPAGRGAAVFFAALDNALGRLNFFDYAYAADYRSRRPVVTTSQRSLYVGVTYRR